MPSSLRFVTPSIPFGGYKNTIGVELSDVKPPPRKVRVSKPPHSCITFLAAIQSRSQHCFNFSRTLLVTLCRALSLPPHCARTVYVPLSPYSASLLPSTPFLPPFSRRQRHTLSVFVGRRFDSTHFTAIDFGVVNSCAPTFTQCRHRIATAAAATTPSSTTWSSPTSSSNSGVIFGRVRTYLCVQSQHTLAIRSLRLVATPVVTRSCPSASYSTRLRCSGVVDCARGCVRVG